MTRTTEEKFDELHGLVADSFLEEIRRLQEEGEGLPPAILTSAAKFLKDNGIDRPARDGDTLDLLNEELPDNITPIDKAM